MAFMGTMMGSRRATRTLALICVLALASPARWASAATVAEIAENPAAFDPKTVTASLFLEERAAARMAPIFQRLMPYWPSIIASYSPLRGTSLLPGFAEYNLNRTLGGQLRLFLVYFIQDVDGVWRLESM